MFKQIIILTSIFLLCLTLSSGEIVFKASFENETVCKDTSTYNNDGTYTGITFSEGLIGNSATFNPDTSLILIPDADQLSFTTGSTDTPLTISLWIKPTVLPTNSILFYKGSNSSNWEYQWNTYSATTDKTTMYLFDVNAGDYKTQESTDIISSYIPDSFNGWIHLLFTYDGNESMNTYINGNIDTTLNTSSGPYDNMYNGNSPLYIGSLPGFSFNYTGSIDEFIMYNEFFTDTDVTDLYNEYTLTEGTGVYTLILIDKELISYNQNISVYRNKEYVDTIVYGESINISNNFNYSLVLHEDNFDRLSNIENIEDISTNGISYLVYAFILIGVIALLGFMYRRF